MTEQWMLFEPSGMVLQLRGDGLYRHDPGNTPEEQQRWRAVAGGQEKTR